MPDELKERWEKHQNFMTNFLTNKNQYKESLLKDWAETFLSRDPGNLTFIDQLYDTYSDYCTKETKTIPFKRKVFAKHLKIFLNEKFTLDSSVNPHSYIEWGFRNGRGVIIRGIKFNENKIKHFALDPEKPIDQRVNEPEKQLVNY